jgi:hypothetical protein
MPRQRNRQLRQQPGVLDLLDHQRSQPTEHHASKIISSTPRPLPDMDIDALRHRRKSARAQDRVVTQDLDTLLTALYVQIDDSIRTSRWRGRPPRLTDSELANPKIGEREVLAAMLDHAAALLADHPGILLISDKGFASKPFERQLTDEYGIELLRPSRTKEKPATANRCSRKSAS